MIKLSFLGAAHAVTGSNYLLEVGDKKFLVDCGMFQGQRKLRDLNYKDFLFSPREIDFVLLTHAHIDHSGLLPKLVKEGFQGQIYATKVTCELSNIMLPDSAHIQEYDTALMNRKYKRSGDIPVQPIYTMEDAQKTLQYFSPVPYNERVDISEEVSVIYHDAGHILGSAIVEVFVRDGKEEVKLVFSGDLGQPNRPILRDPAILSGADYLLVESTYGDRVHEHYDKATALAEIIEDTMEKGGNLVIPCFAVGRTQILLYYLFKLWKEGRLPDYPIIVDSPMAIAATRVFVENSQFFDDEALELFNKSGGFPAMPHLRVCETAEESRALNSEESSAIILSASGMADAGRILHHLKHNLWRPESTVLFVGYQAEGSMGRRLIDGVKRVRILGEEVVVKASIAKMDGFSAHADQRQLLDWVSSFREPTPARVFVVHGEPTAAETLKELIETNMDTEVYIPFYGDSVTIDGRMSKIKTSTLPEVAVEMEMEEVLRTMDSDYRAQRRRILQYVVRNPQHMESVIRTINKGWNYMKKLFSGFNV